MNDGFTVVKKKNSKSKKSYIERARITIGSYANTEALVKRIRDSKATFQSTDLWKYLLGTISADFPQIDEILCYGLGSFCDSFIARCQLAALLCLKDKFKSTVWCFDPIFQPFEKALLEDFELNVIDVNEEAKRIVNPNSNTLLFFPHCPKQLVNNFLWANWNTSLYKCIILSNSFQSVTERNTSKDLNEVSCIRDISQITKEVPLIELGEYSEVFNDISIHTFQASLVPSLSFWSSRKEPVYAQDVEFVKGFESLEISCDGSRK